jgi:hypothetical protein
MLANKITFNDLELHSILINSVRYCLTRHSYAVSECADLLRSKWSQIPASTQNIIRRDIKAAIEEDEMMSAVGQYKYNPVTGDSDIYRKFHKCDRAEWARILEFIDC